MVRRSIAAGAAVLILILLVLGVRGCLNSRKERAIRDYVQDATALAQESRALSRQFFQALSSGGGNRQAVNTENRLNGLRGQAQLLSERARDLDAPDEMKVAQRFAVEAFSFREDGVAGVADAIPDALATQGDRQQGTQKVAQQMQTLLASDVVWAQRVAPSMSSVLRDEQLEGQVAVPESQFVPDVDWLQPTFVSRQIRGLGGGGGGAAAPGLHGTGLGTVTLAGQTLTEGGSVTIPLSGDLSFSVQVADQGENTETDVNVKVTVGRGGSAVTQDKAIDTIAAGETKTVEIPLDQRPATGEQVPVTVEIEPVPGEEKTDNNKLSASAIFTR